MYEIVSTASALPLAFGLVFTQDNVEEKHTNPNLKSGLRFD